MTEDKRFLVDVGMKNLPFPMKVLSKANPDGQQTVANISISARIMHEFEARWIDTFIGVLHQHRERIGTKTLRSNIADYVAKLSASRVNIDFDYPFFIEKLRQSPAKNASSDTCADIQSGLLPTEARPMLSLKLKFPA
jgi:hypothetical protein